MIPQGVIKSVVTLALLLSGFTLSLQGQRQSVAPSSKESVEKYLETYWYRFDFTDSVLVHSTRFEKPFARYLFALSSVDSALQSRAISSLVDSAAIKSYSLREIARLSETYLYDTWSPQYNEELFLQILDAMLGQRSLSKYDKLRPLYLRGNILKNRVGTVAANFNTAPQSAQPRMLHTISAEYTILLFSDPQCQECARLEERIASMPHIFSRQGVEVVKLHPTPQIEELYPLQAIPTLYLLDSEKRVLAKDATLDEVIHLLSDY